MSRGRASCLAIEPAEWQSFRGAGAMADDVKPPSRPGHPVRAVGKTTTERPFDKWLQKQLHAMYDEIASEPLPDDLVSLIERDARGKGTRGKD
jgi:hypothetical protein